MTETKSGPAMKDSDLMWLMVKRLEQIAGKMTRLEYDEALDQMMVEASDLMDWASEQLISRGGQVKKQAEKAAKKMKAKARAAFGTAPDEIIVHAEATLQQVGRDTSGVLVSETGDGGSWLIHKDTLQDVLNLVIEEARK